MLYGRVATAEFASVRRMVTAEVPAAVGVPPIAPETASRVMPAGSAPEATDHAYGVRPPVPVALCEYASVAYPSARVAGEMARSARTMIENDWVAVMPLASVMVTEKVAVPGDAVVFPVMVPLDSITRPAGSPVPAENVYGVLP